MSSCANAPGTVWRQPVPEGSSCRYTATLIPCSAAGARDQAIAATWNSAGYGPTRQESDHDMNRQTHSDEQS